VLLFNASGISNDNPSPDIPQFQRGGNSIYCHPSIRNHMQRKGGAPEQIIWDQINDHPDASVSAFLSEKMSGVAL
jgi:hypothetical protein